MNPLAWNKEVELPSGVVLTYWVMETMEVNFKDASALVYYYGYISEAAYEAGKQPIQSGIAKISLAGMEFNSQVIAAVNELAQVGENGGAA